MSYGINHQVGIKASPEDIYKALTETTKLAQWWTTDTRGSGAKVGDTLEFWFKGASFCQKFKVKELEPGKRVVWKSPKDQGADEWAETEVSFDLSTDKKQTFVQFRHSGFHIEPRKRVRTFVVTRRIILTCPWASSIKTVLLDREGHARGQCEQLAGRRLLDQIRRVYLSVDKHKSRIDFSRLAVAASELTRVRDQADDLALLEAQLIGCSQLMPRGFSRVPRNCPHNRA
jgi:uncharacterized protein YndB with AHSA1/START domain